MLVDRRKGVGHRAQIIDRMVALDARAYANYDCHRQKGALSTGLWAPDTGLLVRPLVHETEPPEHHFLCPFRGQRGLPGAILCKEGKPGVSVTVTPSRTQQLTYHPAASSSSTETPTFVEAHSSGSELARTFFPKTRKGLQLS